MGRFAAIAAHWFAAADRKIRLWAHSWISTHRPWQAKAPTA